MGVTIGAKRRWLWRAVDQDDCMLDEIVQTRRTAKAARRVPTRLMKKRAMAPQRMVADKRRSCGAAKRQDMPDVEHWSHKGSNNRAENSHLPWRNREQMMQRFHSPGALQRFTTVFSTVRNSRLH